MKQNNIMKIKNKHFLQQQKVNFDNKVILLGQLKRCKNEGYVNQKYRHARNERRENIVFQTYKIINYEE